VNRPPVEVADIVRVAGKKFIERSREWITAQHVKVLGAIERCRTAALGGHLDECPCCGYRTPSYNSIYKHFYAGAQGEIGGGRKEIGEDSGQASGRYTRDPGHYRREQLQAPGGARGSKGSFALQRSLCQWRRMG
jgi:hypothetical protein